MASTAEEIHAAILAAAVSELHEPGDPISATDSFRQENNNPAGIRPQHAEKTLRQGQREQFDLGEGVVVTLAAGLIDIMPPPYTMLVVGVENPRARPGTAIEHAWRVYPASNESPSRTLAELLASFGLEVRAGDETGRFIASATAPSGSGVEVLNHGDAYALEAFVKPKRDRTEIAWAFAVDTARYAEHVRRSRG